MRYLSLFTGIGGFELGITRAYEKNMGNRRTTGSSTLELLGNESLSDNSDGNGGRSDPMCVGYSEIDKYATQIYQRHFPEHTNYGDITQINEEELPDFDLLCGGFPCQAFSIAGKRGGFGDTRGTLFFDIARILTAKRPRLLLLENVKGLLSHDEGRTFRTIVSTLDELGYDLQWQVLNSKNHGVPQNRERIFIVGHLRGTPRPEVFPFREANGDPIQGGAEGKEQFARTLDSWGGMNGRGTTIQQLNNPVHSNDRVYGPEGIGPTLNTMQGGRRQPFVADGYECLKCSGEKRSMHGLYCAKIRRLTPKECERLQGFPDGWTEGVSDTQRYKTLGNAVTVNVIEAIMTRLSNQQTGG